MEKVQINDVQMTQKLQLSLLEFPMISLEIELHALTSTSTRSNALFVSGRKIERVYLK